jgi:hypothetical protein
LKPMVDTIDKHGLKTKFLSKHKRNAENFFGLDCEKRDYV